MSPARRSLLWVALCALGCASSHETPLDAGLDAHVAPALDARAAEDAPPIVPPTEWERWLDAFADAICATQVRCASATGHPRSIGECRHSASTIRDSLRPSLGDGRVGFDAAAAAACLDALAAMRCDEHAGYVSLFWNRDLAVCGRAFEPLVPTGGTCRPSRRLYEFWQECAGGSYCDEDPDCGTTCRSRPGPGEPCANEHPSRACTAGWSCGGGTCGTPCADDAECRSDVDPFAICEGGGCVRVPRPAVGEPCGRVPCDTALGLACVDGVCVPSGAAEGEDCSAVLCAYPLHCAAEVCVRPSAAGEPCTYFECEQGLFCADPDGTGSRCAVSREGAPCRLHLLFAGDPCAPDGMRCVGSSPHRCRIPLALGASCADDRECGEWLLCEDGRCARTSLLGEACGVGARCHSSSDCIDGRCEPRPRAGQPCDALRRCLEGRCESGRCELLGAGAACTDDWPPECETMCVAGSCQPATPEGASCFYARECAPGLECRISIDGELARSCQPLCTEW
ncbi:MAG: hypothetical protein M3Y87_26540 [Myxococcota bacterium]|nr:hypothetical protein [Myxococcota bacterium]